MAHNLVTLLVGLWLQAATQQMGEVSMATLAACPDKPNCVCSQATDATHAIEPLTFTGSAEEAWEKLKSVMAALPRTELTGEEPGYIHYVVTTRILRFKDDVEFVLVEGEGRIDVRSASRVGHSDLGVNRKRVEEIRKQFVE